MGVRIHLPSVTAALSEELGLVGIDLRNLRPSELARLLNSTPLGEVISDRQLRRHRTRAGYRIGEGSRIDFLRYAGWLAWERHHQKPQAAGYEDLKEKARQRNLEISRAGRDIGELPDVVDPKRKAKALKSFQFFCESYFPETFHLEWSDDHVRVIEKIETAVVHGGLFAMAMPRGSGKTSLCECAAVWALLTGRHQFVVLIGSDKDSAEELLQSIRTELENNELLLADFPEVCFPIRRLEGIYNRSKGQLYKGKRTHITISEEVIVLPTIENSVAAGGIIKVAGITGRIRGMKYKRPGDHKAVRPSLVIPDDPQTDGSARSPLQCAERERILSGAVLGLSGPGRKISGIMPCTVIRKGDMADRMLDPDVHPDWQGERTKMVYCFPDDEKRWNQYAGIRAEGLINGDRGKAATDFYRKRRKAMDKGAVIAWPARYNHDEISAVQHAMNLKLQDPETFFAEYQNEPVDNAEDDELLTVDEIAGKVNGYKRYEIPDECHFLTVYIDIQKTVLYYVVAAWSEDFTGYVIDYGTYPDQKRTYFLLRDVRRTLAKEFTSAGFEGSIFSGLTKLTDKLFGREWNRDDGAVMRIDVCLIDARWGNSTDTVKRFCRQSRHRVVPGYGQYIGARHKPFEEYKRKKGERLGDHWRMPPVRGTSQIRHVLYDTNHWKTFIHSRFSTALGDRGCVSLFKAKPHEHRMFAEHQRAEYRTKTEGRGRELYEWEEPPSKPDNHFFDCLVGCAVGASTQGCSLQIGGKKKPSQKPKPKRRKRVSYL